MIKQIAWNTFKNTGNINTYMELVQLENVQKALNTKEIEDSNIKVKEYGDVKDKGNNITRK